LEDIHVAIHHDDSEKAKSILATYEIEEEKKKRFDKLRILANRAPIFSLI
ncbi:HNH endonuclease signature motif containing protein, partial [Bacillus sp. 'calajunan']